MEWRCSVCTYINNNGGHTCEICNAKRPRRGFLDIAAVLSAREWHCPVCTFINRNMTFSCQMCGARQSRDKISHQNTKEHYGEMVRDALSAKRNSSTHAGERPGDCSLPSVSESVNSHAVVISSNGLQGDLSSTVSEYGEEKEVRIVMIGRTGVGKSASGNTILGSDQFESTASPASVTKGCQHGVVSRDGRLIQVIDTPGMYDTEMSVPDITKEVIKCVGMTAPGPHAFVLVMTPDRFTEEVQSTIDHFVKIFGEGIMDHLVVLFTKKDDLIYSGKTIEIYLEESGKLQDLMVCCNKRYVTFNNRGTPAEKEKDVKSLLDLIDEMVQKNRGVYTNEMFQQAERLMMEEENRLKREHEEELERERNQIEEAYRLELHSVEQAHAETVLQMQKRLQCLEEERAAGRSCQDTDDMRRQLNNMRAQHQREIRQIQENARKERDVLERRNVCFRNKARDELTEDSSFLMGSLLPVIWDIAKMLLPLIFRL